ncbi:MAG: hypothetical protein OMM_13750 [Candidatus Magnetoglobus multicellularis str. Araruama]|uniref:Carrier domain-containing protein n=1 Tax=Candidatus Magnetoglobus multicellularis str. Araruama TaxID=890399 RepID=A0A1V1NT88_9BACT|nr:MAG: hypothetical protein OMM_13750 [Candidatus Magnetoglobus multicellularis str. Araruama]
MMIDQITTKIHEFIIKQLNNGEYFEIDADLIQQLLIDSMGVMKLISFLETTYDIEIDLIKIRPENFQTIKAISDLVILSMKKNMEM